MTTEAAQKLTYEELQTRLLETEGILGALRNHEVDAIVGEEHIAVVRLQEAEAALAQAREELEQRVVERTAELAQANRQLRQIIKDQKLIQQRLEQSERWHRDLADRLRDQAELLDLAHDMIFVHDMEGRIVFWNRGAEAAYGWKREEALGRLSHELLRTEFAEPLLRITARIIQDGWWEGELVQTTRDGRRVTVATRWALRKSPDGEPAAVLEIDNDITARKQAEREMAEARRLAESMVDTIQADKEQLNSLTEELMTIEDCQRRQIAQALHDSVGQSLAFSRRELNLLRQRGPEEIRATLGEVCAQLDDAIRQTRELTLELSPATLYSLGLQPALEELAEQFTEAEGFRCRVDGPGERLPLDEQVRSLLYRAVRELLVNVAKHAEARSVGIALDHDEQGLRITVQDDGRGFDPSILAGRCATAGFGILSIRERLTRIGGAFAVEAQEGKGTKVTMIVPVHRGQQSDSGG